MPNNDGSSLPELSGSPGEREAGARTRAYIFSQTPAQRAVLLCPAPSRSREELILGDETLKRTDTLPSATVQETDWLLAQQLLLRDHSPLGMAAVFALTV